MQRMVDIVPITIRNMGLQKKYNSQSIIVHWKKIVGDEIATHAYPTNVQSGIVVLSVNNSVWSHHLSMMKESIISKINDFIGEKLILDIRFQAGYLKKLQNEEDTNTDMHSSHKHKFNKIKLEESDLKLIHQTVEPIHDNYLKQKIVRIMRRDFLLKKIKKQSNWHQCASCTVLCPPDQSYCSVCKLTKKHEVITRIISTLKQIPWIRHHELNEHIPCTDEEFHQAKYTLVSSIGRAIQDGDTDKFNIMIFIMLTTGAKIEAINEAVINKTLDKFRRKK
ncbi:DUF721 domain-containing protein [Pelosinus sp. sgz500959]|uniref:DUF721 domain-containing protein n=1 Tax=Pelosinus sp. sgz500959 TaxID=3242472 RepID=UPI00366C6EA5